MYICIHPVHSAIDAHRQLFHEMPLGVRDTAVLFQAVECRTLEINILSLVHGMFI